jgi:flagellar hook-basal body complex protein FliE
MPNIPLAKQLIEQAADLCVSTTVTADRHADYVARRDAKIKPKSTPITTSAEELLKEAKKEIVGQLKKAEEEAAKHDYDKAHGLLDDVLAKSEKAAALKEADTKYKSSLQQVKLAVGGLTTSTPPNTDPVIGSDIGKINQKIEAAKLEAAKPDYEKALKLLDEAETAQKVASATKKMKGATPPTEQELKDLMNKPGGTKLLDGIVASLGATAKKEVLLLAMKVRFGLDAAVSIAAGDKDAPETAETGTDSDLSLNKIYSLLTKVPDKHTKDNPSFKKIKRYAGDPGTAGQKAGAKGDYYEPTGKEIVLSVGSPGAYNKKLLDPAHLPGVTDPNCQLADPTPPTHFDNNTLHEAAHAIDDKKKFMQRNGSTPAYGGWIDHGADVMPAATAAAKALNYDAVYIAKYLVQEAGIVEPPPPDGTSATNWNAARDKAKTWADAIRFDQSPWDKGANCDKGITAGGFKIGDRVYHQAYSTKWVSYLAASRKQGVSGYQFRAPGEWFAELYAAYGTRKLKKTHPAVVLFLEKMFPLDPPLA